MDINVKPSYDVPMWSETRFIGAYNPQQGVGLFLHVGRLRNHLDWWWAQTIIYLPDGRIAVDRSWARNPDDNLVQTANLMLRPEQGGWSARFDGIVELTDTAALGRAPRGSAAPSLPAKFELIAEGTRPWWDMLAGATTPQSFGDMHVEQAGHCHGALQVGSEAYRLDGISCYDHSSGVRDWTGFHSHHFLIIVMPDYTMHAGQVYTSPTEERRGGGVWFTSEGEMLRITRSEMPRQIDVFGAPQQFDWRMKLAGKGEMTFRIEVLHSFPATITFDNDNINGCDWDAAGDPMFLTECPVRVTAPDGTVGYGHIERSNRRSCLVKP